MCGGVLYHYQGVEVKTYFPNPASKLPVLCHDRQVVLFPWGRRQQQQGQLPLGGWARLESIKAGRWQRYFPKPVKVPLVSFMEKDFNSQSHWYPLQSGQWVQGLLATLDEERRVYIVTITPQHEQAVHDRWPRIISS